MNHGGIILEARRTWENLSRYESHDYIGKWYTRRHRRTLSASRTKEITSCFIQGREYFVSAASSANSVRPLLLYYGVLALSRGVILLRDPAKNEANLKPSHGLEVVDWQGTLARGISGILDVEIRATNGTFGELVTAVGSQQQTAWFTLPRFAPGYFHSTYPNPKFLTDNSKIKLDDLLSRDCRLLSTYSETTGRPTRVHLCEVVADQNAVEFSIFNLGGSVTQELVETKFGWPEGTVVNARPQARRMPIPNYFITLPHSDLNAVKPVIPLTQYTGNDGMFVLEDFSNGDRYSELLRTFLLSYILGMLVRYFPSRWIALLRNEKGDVAQPLLVGAMNAIEVDYPELIKGALT